MLKMTSNSSSIEFTYYTRKKGYFLVVMATLDLDASSRVGGGGEGVRGIRKPQNRVEKH